MIERFDASYEGLIDAPAGEYVYYSDHESIVSTIKAKLEEKDAEFNKHKELLRKQCNHSQDLSAKLEKAEAALEKINQEEINSQRPGGSYSLSAKISYEALKEIRK